MGYVLLYLYILLPAAAFTVSLLISLYSCFGKWKWLWIIPSGVLYMLAPYVTLSAANTLSTGHLYAPDFTLLPVGALISLAGMLTGALIRRLKCGK